MPLISITSNKTTIIIMAKKENKKKETKKIQLGEKANYFHDPVTGVSVSPREVVELKRSQYNSRRIKSALANGHLSIATDDDADEVEISEEKLLKLKTQIEKFASAGKDVVKSSAAFSIEELKAIAEAYEIEPEETDTKEILVEAIFSKITDK